MQSEAQWRRDTAVKHYKSKVAEGVPPGRAVEAAAAYAGVTKDNVVAWVKADEQR